MSLEVLLFYIFAVVTVLSGFFVVTLKNLVHSAYSLFLTLFGIAGLYVLLAADFIALIQIIIYVGGILILILFGVMLTKRMTGVSMATGFRYIIPATIATGIISGFLLYTILNSEWKSAMPITGTSIQNIGRVLVNDWVLVFEVLGVLLLVALVGAASLARKER